MKRGFLLRAEGRKKAASKPRGPGKQTESLPTTLEATPARTFKGFDVDKDGRVLGKLAYGHLTEEEKALPSDYDPKKGKFEYKESDSTLTDLGNNTVITTIPQPLPDDETQCEWIVNGSTKEKVLNAPGYPARIPKPHRPDLYQVRSTPEMGEGLYAKRNIKRGDLILAERPLLVAPRGIRPLSKGAIPDHYTGQQIQQIIMFEFESVLETAISRLPAKDQADFKALHNAHTSDGSGPLMGIIRTNGYAIDKLYDGSNKVAKYGAVCNIGSRINHSCIPNVKYKFKLNSFSMQFYALRDIKAGDQLFYAYCTSHGNLAQRKAEIAPYGFVCKCPACVNATPETDKLRNTFAARIAIFKTMIESSSKIDETVLEDAVRLEKDMVKEGLDHPDNTFVTLLTAISLAYGKLGKLEESEKYGVVVESFKNCFTDDG